MNLAFAKKFPRITRTAGNLAIMVIIACGWATLAPVSGREPLTGSLRQERFNDEIMWQVAMQMLVETGHADMTNQFQAIWNKAAAPKRAATRLASNENIYETNLAAVVALFTASSASVNFSTSFQMACGGVSNVPDLFAGMARWTIGRGKPMIQGDRHLALHFIYGGVFEATTGLGYAAAIGKETLDESEGGSFNLNQMGAAMAGAEWVHQARLNPDWIRQWASGEKTLEKTLPHLQYGDRNGNGKYSKALVEKIHHDILVAYGD